ncbi:unnamed protein product [Acanthoscelides obtectus]|uniref:Uncharacterized protein n=1 Tax=Acanthoscelides obtectus TaxID=200917 RepID=A0A9P0Q886_ACAOB|nr:unnamed protein product [Acanthoscelides obtectus]CAK1664676.1 hypothetical protein AOBTE_LOCUS24411 [Acanthoscelides obtectus]
MPKQKQRKSRKRSRREPSSSSTTSSSSGSSSNNVRDERDVRMAVQSNSMSVAADRQIDGGWGKMTRRQDANALNRFNAAQ